MKKVEIFLSDFGRERLKEEESLGPMELRNHQREDEESYEDLAKSGKKVSKLGKKIFFAIFEIYLLDVCFTMNGLE